MKKILFIITLIGTIGLGPVFGNTPDRHHHDRESITQANGDVIKVNHKNDGRVERTFRKGNRIEKRRFYDNGKVKTKKYNDIYKKNM